MASTSASAERGSSKCSRMSAAVIRAASSGWRNIAVSGWMAVGVTPSRWKWPDAAPCPRTRGRYSSHAVAAVISRTRPSVQARSAGFADRRIFIAQEAHQRSAAVRIFHARQHAGRLDFQRRRSGFQRVNQSFNGFGPPARHAAVARMRRQSSSCTSSEISVSSDSFGIVDSHIGYWTIQKRLPPRFTTRGRPSILTDSTRL